MDAQEHINYWKKSSDEDFAAARSLLEKGHLRHSLFFTHLAIEKALKAHVTKEINDVPPRIHNLIRLMEIAGLKVNQQQQEFLREFGVYQLQGRYPDSEQISLDEDTVRTEISKAGETIKWLISQL